MPRISSFASTLNLLNKAVQIAKKRHSMIANNISNADTPNFKAKDLDFDGMLKEMMARDGDGGLTTTHSRHINPGIESETEFFAEDSEQEFNGVNYVDIDREIARLTENNLVFRSGVDAMLRRIATLKEVIREGGR